MTLHDGGNSVLRKLVNYTHCFLMHCNFHIHITNCIYILVSFFKLFGYSKAYQKSIIKQAFDIAMGREMHYFGFKAYIYANLTKFKSIWTKKCMRFYKYISFSFALYYRFLYYEYACMQHKTH